MAWHERVQQSVPPLSELPGRSRTVLASGALGGRAYRRWRRRLVDSMSRYRLDRLSGIRHAQLAAELHMQWPPAHRAVRPFEKPDRHRADSRQFQQTGEFRP